MYWNDTRLIKKYTLEDIMKSLGVDHIDLLKLDCEGSEFSILENTPSLDKIRFIVGEYHDYTRWQELLKNKFSNWDYGQMYRSSNGLGLFHLSNRNFK